MSKLVSLNKRENLQEYIARTGENLEYGMIVGYTKEGTMMGLPFGGITVLEAFFALAQYSSEMLEHEDE